MARRKCQRRQSPEAGEFGEWAGGPQFAHPHIGSCEHIDAATLDFRAEGPRPFGPFGQGPFGVLLLGKGARTDVNPRRLAAATNRQDVRTPLIRRPALENLAAWNGRRIELAVAEQAFQRLDPAPLRRPAQTAGAKSGPVIHFLSPLQAVETEFRSSAPACDKTNYQKSGTRSRQESHDEPKVQRTQSMTGNVALATNPSAEGYGGQSGSAYRRSGRFGTPANRPVRRVQRKRRLAFAAKRNVGTKMLGVAMTGAVASATPKR